MSIDYTNANTKSNKALYTHKKNEKLFWSDEEVVVNDKRGGDQNKTIIARTTKPISIKKYSKMVITLVEYENDCILKISALNNQNSNVDDSKKPISLFLNRI